MERAEKQAFGDFVTARRTLPLVRSIAREIRERSRTIQVLDGRLERGARDEGGLIGRLAVHRRELRVAEKELARLGWAVECTEPMRFVYRGPDGAAGLTWQPEDTGFYRVPSETA